MFEMLVFWALALYGAMMLVLQVVKRLQSRSQRSIYPVSLVLIVEDDEAEIEGLIRGLEVRFALSDRLSAIHVIDLSAGHETGEIVRRLAMKQPRLIYRRAQTESALAEPLQEACLGGTSVGYVYDLRTKGTSRDVRNDLAAILQ